MPDRIVVGRIVKPHGIRGEVIVESQTEAADERFVAGATLFVGDPASEDSAAVRIEAARPHQGRYIVAFEHVDDRTQAETLRNVLLSIPSGQARPPAPGRYYPHDLEGLDVFDESGGTLGVLTGVLDNPANDLWIVRTPAGKDVLVPAVREFVRDVDLERKRIVVRPIPGLFSDEE